VGAVIVKDGQIIARGHNMKESLPDPTAHAEILAIRRAAERLGSWRLSGCTLYVTLEPCAMCAAALVQARVGQLILGAWDPKAGACGSILNLVQFAPFNHRMEVLGGILEDESRDLLQQFFHSRRKK